jgi:hypothetical protein
MCLYSSLLGRKKQCETDDHKQHHVQFTQVLRSFLGSLIAGHTSKDNQLLCYGGNGTFGGESQLQPDGVAYSDGTLQGA